MKSQRPMLVGAQAALTATRKDILAAGPFGSEEDDLDILVVLREPDVSVGEKIFCAMRKALPEALFYPTFRVEALLRGRTHRRKRCVHLLLYPSLAVFRRVERPFVRYCIVRSFTPWVGKRETLVAGEHRPPAPDMAYYLDLLFETMQIYLMGSFSDRASLNEARKKLLYIIKFSCLEAFYRQGAAIDLRRIAATVFSHTESPVLAQAERVYREVKRWDKPSRETVMRAFVKTAGILNELSELRKSHAS